MTPEQFEAVCKELEATDCGTLKTCQKLGVPIRSFYDGLERDPAMAQRYARAKELQADRMAESIVEIADGTSEDVNRDKLRVDARKWVAAKLLPKRYGDRQTISLENESTEDLLKLLGKTHD